MSRDCVCLQLHITEQTMVQPEHCCRHHYATRARTFDSGGILPVSLSPSRSHCSETPSITSHLAQDMDTDDNCCWICLQPESTVLGALEQPCACPRSCHIRCLSRWQLQSAGRRRVATSCVVQQVVALCSCTWAAAPSSPAFAFVRFVQGPFLVWSHQLHWQ